MMHSIWRSSFRITHCQLCFSRINAETFLCVCRRLGRAEAEGDQERPPRHACICWLCHGRSGNLHLSTSAHAKCAPWTCNFPSRPRHWWTDTNCERMLQERANASIPVQVTGKGPLGALAEHLSDPISKFPDTPTNHRIRCSLQCLV